MAWLIKSTNEFRLESIEEVKQFEQKMRDKAKTEGFNVLNFAYAEKYIKEKQEIVGSYYQVKITFTFNELKDPCFSFHSVEFPQGDSAF